MSVQKTLIKPKLLLFGKHVCFTI